jgi:hypothetical protein
LLLLLLLLHGLVLLHPQLLLCKLLQDLQFEGRLLLQPLLLRCQRLPLLPRLLLRLQELLLQPCNQGQRLYSLLLCRLLLYCLLLYRLLLCTVRRLFGATCA